MKAGDFIRDTRSYPDHLGSFVGTRAVVIRVSRPESAEVVGYIEWEVLEVDTDHPTQHAEPGDRNVDHIYHPNHPQYSQRLDWFHPDSEIEIIERGA